jgi:hypothetical protein
MPVERIKNLPAGTPLFLDAKQVLGITTLDVVNEVTHRMMLAEALGSGVIKRDSVRIYEANGGKSLNSQNTGHKHRRSLV